jgi:hypothetical protein
MTSSFLKNLVAILALALAGLTAASAQFTTQAIPGGVRITGYTGTVPANLVIPLQIGGTVLEIAAGAFQNQDTITTLTLPTSLTTIGANAFRDCDNLGSVFIPASVSSIGIGAFAACDRLASIEVDVTNGAYTSQDGVLYDLVTSAGNAILHQYPAGRPGSSYMIPPALATAEPVIAIAARTFEQAQNLLAMEFANNVAAIGPNAFENAPRLARVTFDNQVTSIGASSFNGTASLTFATFLGNAPATFGASVFSGASAGFEVRYLQGVVGFSAPTWTPNPGQTYNSRIIQTDGNFTYIVSGGAAEILSPEPLAAPVVVFSVNGTDGNNTINASGSAFAANQPIRFSALAGGEGLNTTTTYFVINPNGASFQVSNTRGGVAVDFTTNIANGTLVALTDIPSTIANLPVRSIAAYAFTGDLNIRGLVFPSSLSSVGQDAFYGCSNLAIVSPVLLNPTGPAALNIPANLASIGVGAFGGCPLLFSIYVDPFNPSYSSSPTNNALLDKAGRKLIQYPITDNPTTPIRAYDIPAAITEIGERAFEDNASLVRVNFSERLTTVGRRAFFNNRSLASVRFEDQLSSIGAEAFATSFGSLGEVIFLGKAPQVGSNVFLGSTAQFVVRYLRGIGAFSGATPFPSGASGTWNGYNALEFRIDGNWEFSTNNGTISVMDYRGIPPQTGSFLQDFFEDFVDLRPTPDDSRANADAIVDLLPGRPTGQRVLAVDTDTIYTLDSYDNLAGRWNISVLNTNSARLRLSPTTPLGLVVLEQDNTGPIYYQKVADDGSLATHWIQVNFQLPSFIAGLPVVEIMDFAFSGSTMRSIALPPSLTKIGANAFLDCRNLGLFNDQRAIFLPAAINEIRTAPFVGCNNLQSIIVHALNPFFTSTDGVLYSKNQSKLVQYPPGKLGSQFTTLPATQEIAASAFEGNRFLTVFTAANNLAKIGERSFFGSQSLVQARFGSGVSEFDNAAFSDIPSLSSVVFTGNAPKSENFGSDVFSRASNNFVVTYNPGSTGFTSPSWQISGQTYNSQIVNSNDEFLFSTGNGTATVIGYLGNGGAVRIPSTFGQLAVRRIADNAFKGRSGITSVEFPNSVSSIGDAAFKDVDTLASVSFGSGLTSIGKEAFYGCNELTEVSISAAITSIGEAAFAACEKLIAIKVNPNNSNYRSTPYLNGAGEVLFDRTQKKLLQYPAGIQQSTYEIPATVETIGKRAFEGAVYLSVIEFPATVKTIEERAFYNTAALVTVRFGRGVTTIQNEAFAGTITPLNAAIFYGPAPTSFGINVFQGALQTFEVRYLEGAQGFPTGAGGTWNGYKAVAIKEINDFEFRLIDNNTKIEITGYTGLAPTIMADRSTLPTPNIVVPDRAARLALTDINTQLNTRLPEGALVLQQDDDLIWQINYTPVGVPIWTVYDNSGARFLLPSALPLGTVVLEQNGVSKVYYQKIGLPGAATSNWIVVDFRIPDTLSGLPVTSIADRAFENNSVIQSVVLPNSLTKIGVKAFAGCSKLGGLVSGNTLGGVFLPAGVTTYGAGAFASCGLLQQIIVHPSNQVYSSTDGVMFNKRGTQLVQFPAGLATTTYFFPEAVIDIAGSAFEGNAYLAELEFPRTVRTIGAEAFLGSKTLVTVLFGTGVSSLGERAFASIPSLGEAIFFGESPATVGADVFLGAASDFRVLYVQGAKGFPAGSSGLWKGYPAQAITAFDDFDFQIVPGGAEILGYLGDVSEIRFEADLTTLPQPNQIVTNQAARLALPAGLPTGWNVLERSTNLLWYVESQTAATDNSPAQNNWAVRVTAGDRLLLDPTIPVGTTFKEQSATAALFYQKVSMPGTNATDWIRISNRTLRIPETIAGLSVVSIAEEAFKDNRLLEAVVFPNSMKKIGDFAFKNCPRLGLPDGFSGDNRGVFLPSAVDNIGVGVFSSCTGLSDIRVHNSNKAYSDIQGVLFNRAQTRLIQFPGGKFLESYTLFARATSIADHAFEGNANLETVVITAACSEIGIGAFQGALSLTSVSVGNGVRRIGDLAFSSIASLDNVTFQGNAPQLLGPDVFANRSSGFRILFNARSTGFNQSPWTPGLPIQPVWLPSGPGDPPPASTGFRAVGYVDPAEFNNFIGGQIQIAVSRSRIATGVLVLGSNSTAGNGFFPAFTTVSTNAAGALITYRFRGEMDEFGNLTVSIPRRGEVDLQLNLQFELLEAPTFFKLSQNSVLTDGLEEASVSAGMIPWSRTVPAQPYAGIYNIAFDAETGGQDVAPGYGFTGLTVDGRTGAARLLGVLGDGTRFTGASWVLGDGSIPLWFPLYTNRGMLVGEMLLGPAGSSLATDILWSKPGGVPRSPDPDGFTEVLLTASAGSGRFVAPSPQAFSSFSLNFVGEPGSGVSFSQAFKLELGRIVPAPPNANQVRAAWNLRGGLVQGTYTLPAGPIGRFQGIILSDGKVRGNFVLPNSATRPDKFYGGNVENN